LTFVVNESCIRCKIMDCVEVCPVTSVIPFAAIERPACPKCKARMMLVSIKPARARGVDLRGLQSGTYDLCRD
jgi:hypothetical protein